MASERAKQLAEQRAALRAKHPPKRQRQDVSQPPPQGELLPPHHGAAHPRRLRKPYTGTPNPEAFYVAAWAKANPRGRAGYLHHLLTTDAQHERGISMVPYTRRDAYVAATVIQWLGTNVGRGFVLEVERQIEAARAKHHQLSAVRRRLQPPECSYPHCGCAVSFPEGYKPGPAQCPRVPTPVQRRKQTLDKTRARLGAATKKGGAK